VLSESRVKEMENCELVQFLKWTDRSCAFSWSICDTKVTHYCVYRERQFLGYVSICEENISKGEQQQKATLAERDRSSYIVFVVCIMSFIVCVVLCAVFCSSVVCYFV
jgi:hypothetical protein